MTAWYPHRHSFNGGELSPLMEGRADTRIHSIGAAEMENFAPCIEGPMQKVPGFRRIAAAMAQSSWLAQFVFNATQAYVLECGQQKIRFYTNGGQIQTSPGTPLEVTVPHGAADWPLVSMQQSFDRLYMAHRSHAPGALSRTGAAAFSYAPLALKNGPFKDANSDPGNRITITGTLTTGGSATITVTSGGPIFQSGHVGALFQVEALDFSDITAWEPGLDNVVSGTSRVRSDGKVYVAASAGRTGTVQPTHDEGSEWDGSNRGTDINDKGPFGVRWTYEHDRFGILQITAVAPGGMSATATVVRRVPSSLSSVSSWRWAHGAFSNAEGWPNLVFVWNGRLCFWKDYELHGSVVGDFLNFQAYDSAGFLSDDLAFRLVLAAPDPPQWVVVDRELLVGTASAEYAIGAVNAAAAVSAANIRAVKQSSYGSEPVWPVEPGTSVVFVQRGGRQFREAEYDFGRDRYVAANINRWARHIGKGGIRQMGQQADPEELLFAVRRDGQLIFRSYDPEQEVKGFSRRTLGGGGQILSSVCIPGSDAPDEIWALCQWGEAKSIQQMTPWWVQGSDVADAFFVDDGLSDALDVPSTTISGLNHLIGETVCILADGSRVEPMTVPPSGTLTLPIAARKRVVGRGYAARYRALRSGGEGPDGGQVMGRRQIVKSLVLRLIDSARVLVSGGGRAEAINDSAIAAPLGSAPPLFAGDTIRKPVEGQWSRDGRWSIETDATDPRPAFVLAMMPQVEIGGEPGK